MKIKEYTQMSWSKHFVLIFLVIFAQACRTDENQLEQPQPAVAEEEVPAAKVVTVYEIEDTLNLCQYTITPQYAADGVQHAKDWIKLNQQSLPELVATLSRTQVIRMRDSALHAYQRTNSPGSQYITALKITFGLDSVLKVISPLYQTLTLKLQTGSNEYFMVLDTATPLYKYKAGAFQLANNTDKKWISYYRDNIMIKDLAGPPHPFRNSNDSIGDTKSLVFSFQEIDSVFLSNSADSLKIWSYAFREKIGATTYTKHNLLLSPGDLTPLTLKELKNANSVGFYLTAFQGQFANHSHLCPPNCNTMAFLRLKVQRSCPPTIAKEPKK